MVEKHINEEHFRIPRPELEKRTGIDLNGRFRDYSMVVPFRDMGQVDHLAFMTEEGIDKLIRAIPLRGDKRIKPYEDSQIELYCREPKGILLSQRFVLESKLLNLMSSFCDANLFRGFITKGISDMPPAIIYGRDTEDEKVLSLYLPPIVEQRSEGDVLLDGTHRCYICRSVGSSAYMIHVKGVPASYPTTPVTWDECQLYSEKPDTSVRYKGLNKNLFRDLNYVGIDG